MREKTKTWLSIGGAVALTAGIITAAVVSTAQTGVASVDENTTIGRETDTELVETPTEPTPAPSPVEEVEPVDEVEPPAEPAPPAPQPPTQPAPPATDPTSPPAPPYDLDYGNPPPPPPPNPNDGPGSPSEP